MQRTCNYNPVKCKTFHCSNNCKIALKKSSFQDLFKDLRFLFFLVQRKMNQSIDL